MTGFHRHLFLFLKSTIWASDYRIILNIRGDHNFENLAQDSGLIPNPFYHFSTARMMNSGQSCIAAKRFILVGDAYDKFLPAFIDGVKAIKKGDPADEATEIGPLARKDLANELHKQLEESVKKGAKIETEGKQEDAFYEPTVLTGVKPGMPAFKGAADVSSTIVNSVKDVAVTTIKGTGDLVVKGIQLPASIVKGAIDGVVNIGVSLIKAVKGIVNGAVQGAMSEGVDQKEAVTGAVQQAMYSAKELGANVASVAVESVTGAVKGVKQVGGDSVGATKTAILAALEAARDIGGGSVDAVNTALIDSVDGAKKILDEIKKDKESA